MRGPVTDATAVCDMGKDHSLRPQRFLLVLSVLSVFGGEEGLTRTAWSEMVRARVGSWTGKIDLSPNGRFCIHCQSPLANGIIRQISLRRFVSDAKLTSCDPSLTDLTSMALAMTGAIENGLQHPLSVLRQTS